MVNPHPMTLRRKRAALLLVIACVAGMAAKAEDAGHPWDVMRGTGIVDTRLSHVRGTDTLFEMTAFDSLGEWEAYSEGLRRRILVSCGLWPMPERPPLNAHVFDAIDRGAYTVSKVHFEAYRGFLVTGNLYLPKGDGPFPAIICPHGHWEEGRLENTQRASVAARCITFARMGIAAFSYDMVGYNDSRQFSRPWGHSGDSVPAEERRRQALWGIHPFAIQLWSSIRALDFMESLEQIDRDRLGCTGASGGGTQTFALTAVDGRVKVAAPVNMISHSMQGGCVCENAPLIRIEASNMEVGALFAPKPLLMVSATGDWTRETPTLEFPAIRGVYRLYGAGERVGNVHVGAPHNYNLRSREAVYRHFGNWLLGEPDRYAEFTEPPYKMEEMDALRVFPGDGAVEGYVSAERLVAQLINMQREKWAQLKKVNAEAGVDLQGSYREVLGDAFGLDSERPLDVKAVGAGVVSGPGFREARYVLQVAQTGAAIPAILFELAEPKDPVPVLIVHGEGKSALSDANGEPIGAAREWLSKGRTIALIDAFGTGEMQGERKHGGFPDTFAPTDTAYRVQDIIAAIRWLKREYAGRLDVVGLGEAGLWCLFAAALESPGGHIFVDLNGFNSDDDAAWVARYYVPSIRSLGDIATAAYLIEPGRLTIF